MALDKNISNINKIAKKRLDETDISPEADMTHDEFEEKVEKVIRQMDLEFRIAQAQNDYEWQVEQRAQEKYRARSVSVGGESGSIEINMRMHNGHHAWCTLQPAEAVELAHQIAAQCGCLISIKPRDDFSSWRKWNNEERIEYRSLSTMQLEKQEVGREKMLPHQMEPETGLPAQDVIGKTEGIVKPTDDEAVGSNTADNRSVGSKPRETKK